MADTRVAVAVPMDKENVEAISQKTSTVSDSLPPLNYSFMGLTCFEDCEREEPREPANVKAAILDSHGKYAGRCIRMHNNAITEVTQMMATVEKLCVNPENIGWIDLSFNAIQLIDNSLLEFPNLLILNLHGNNITNLREVDKLAGLTKLRKLSLHGNGIEQQKGYRHYVVSTLPGLQCLDFSRVTKAEILSAQSWRRMNCTQKKKKKIQEEN